MFRGKWPLTTGHQQLSSLPLVENTNSPLEKSKTQPWLPEVRKEPFLSFSSKTNHRLSFDRTRLFAATESVSQVHYQQNGSLVMAFDSKVEYLKVWGIQLLLPCVWLSLVPVDGKEMVKYFTISNLESSAFSKYGRPSNSTRLVLPRLDLKDICQTHQLRIRHSHLTVLFPHFLRVERKIFRN